MAKRRCAISLSSWACASFAVLAGTIAWSAPAKAEERRLAIEVEATRLPQALAELSREAGVSIGAEGRLPDIPTRAVRGRMSVAQALERILAGSGFAARMVGPTAWRVERAAEVAAAPATAASTTPPETVTEPIIVTGAKRALALDDAPFAVSVIGGDGITGIGLRGGAGQVALRSEGLSVTELGAGRNRLFLRGISDSAFSGESQGTVAVLLDETRLTYSAPDPDIRLVDVERVEVVKGPQGSLYGTGALGGLYHIVSRQPDPASTSLTVSGGGDAVVGGALGYSEAAVVNLPLSRDALALRLVGYATREPGWVDTGTRQNGNATRVSGGRAILALTPASNWRFEVRALAQYLNSRDSSYVYAPGRRSRPAQLREPADNDIRHVAFHGTRTGGPVELSFTSGGTWHEISETADATIGADSLGLANPRSFDDERRYRVWDNELKATGRLGRIGWLAGLSYLRARQAETQVLSGFSGNRLQVDDEFRQSIDTAAFGQLTVPVGSGLKLDLGGRLFHSSVKERRRLPIGGVASQRDRSGVTPGGALSWQPRPGRLLWVRYGSAFRPGGIDVAPNGSLSRLKGDELATIEAGWRETGRSGRRLDVGIWYSVWENLQSDRLGSDGLIDTTNAGNARVLGAEATLVQPLWNSSRLELGANLTDALLTRNDLGIRLDDRRLPVVPRYTLRAAFEHELGIGSRQVAVGAMVRFSGPARLSFDPALDRAMGETVDTEFHAGTRMAGWEFSLRMSNLFGGSKNTFAYGNPFRLGTMRQYVPQQPFTGSIGVSRRF